VTITPESSDGCEEVGAVDPAAVCGATVAAHRRCIAHLTPDQRAAYWATLTAGCDLDLRGVTFTSSLLAELLDAMRDEHDVPHLGRADFSDTVFTDDADFGGVGFDGETLFVGVGFGGRVNFAEANFLSSVTFNGGSVAGFADFFETSFTGGVLFLAITFTSEVRFNGARFAGDSGFSSLAFTEGASFFSAAFAGRTVFNYTVFSGEANFSGVTFSGPTQLGCCADIINLGEATIRADLLVEAAATRIDAGQMRAENRVTLRLRAARLDLTDSVFSRSVSVHGLQQPISWIDESPPADPATSNTSTVSVTSLRGVDAERLILTDVDLSECLFTGMHRGDQLRLDGSCTFAPAPRTGRQTIAEEHHWRASRTPNRGWTPAPEGVEVVSPARLEVVYRQLRKAVEDTKNEPGAADFYYGEMEMRRAGYPLPTTGRPRHRGQRPLLWLYWASSGYALRALRATTWLVVTIACAIAALTIWGFPTTATVTQATGALTAPAGPQPLTITVNQADPVKPWTTRIEKATETTLNAVIFRGADTQLTTTGRYVDIAARILGPLFLGLSVLAIRNQVKR
jgi:uncharacterized protein YjbI with pentapeptide repeats